MIIRVQEINLCKSVLSVGNYSCNVDCEKEFCDYIKAVFSQKVWSFQEKAVPLQQQFPPRLLTMRTMAGLRHL